MSRKPMPDVLVILPGIMGSVLQKDGQDRWAVSSGAVRRAIWTLGKSIKDLALEDDSSTEDLLDDGVTAPRLIEDVHLIPGFWKIDGYTKLVSEIKDRFKVTEEQNLFKFPYDWRRDNRAAAHRLARLSRTWLEAWRKESGNQSAKLILIAHSMGGIISRYFLEVLEG
ncbi:MAG: hypothetical protein JNN15_18835, partial [Blastocatellia bacterium]|nr:hypothetical protein [Blastocatellia bacterium]